MYEIYLNIKKLRQERGWSQEDLAKKMGYSGKSMISRIENGKINLQQSQIMMFAKVFGVDAGVLFGNDGLTEDAQNNNDESYYIDEKAREIAEFMHKNPDYSALFDASRKVKPENLEIVKQIIEKFSDGN